MDAKVELEAFLVLQDEVILDWEIFRVVGVDNGKLASLEDYIQRVQKSASRRATRSRKRTGILNLHAQQEEMGELGDVDRTDSSLAEVARPVVLEVLVEDAVPDVVREQVLNLDGSAETKRDSGVDAIKECEQGIAVEKKKKRPHRTSGSDLS